MEIPLSISTHWGDTSGSEERKRELAMDVRGLKAAEGSVDIQGQWRCETTLRGFQTERSLGTT